MSGAFAERLKELMALEGLTDFGLAQATGITLKCVHTWTRNIFYPKVKALLILSDYFKVSIDYLLGVSNVIEERTLKSITVEQAQESVVKCLEKYRAEEEIKYGRLARLLSVEQGTLMRWIKKGAMPETTILIRIAELLGITLEELLGRE